MKIVFVSHNYPAIVDGVGDHTFFLAKALRKFGHEVIVICPAKKEIIEQQHPFTYPIVERWNIHGYNVVLNKIKELKPEWVSIPYVPYAFNKWGMPVELIFFVFFLRRINVKICINFHEVQIRYNWKSKKSYIVGTVQRIIAYSLCLFAHKLVTSIEFYRDYLVKYSSKPIQIIPIPPNYDTDIILGENSIRQVRKLVAANNEKVIATYGIRDLSTVIKVFSGLNEYFPNCRLLFCGRLYRLEAFKEIQDKVYVTGYLSHDQVYTYLKAADVFYIPDPVDHKGRGGTCNKSGSLAAALVAGLPVIGTLGDLNNPSLQKSKQIKLVNINDTETTVKGIVDFLSTQNSEIIDHNWCLRLNWNTIAKQFADFLQLSAES